MTEECVKSLVENTKNLGEIILIDDHSTEDFTKIFDVEYHLNKGSGVTDAWNYGASLAKCDYICWCNNDLLFSPGWDVPLMKGLNNDVWITSPYHTNGEVPKDFPLGKDRKNNMEGANVGIPFLGSCFMMEKKNWLRVGPIDPRVKIWCGDNYLYESITYDFGRKCAELPESYVHHFCTQTLNRERAFIDTKGDIENFEIIYGERRWGDQSVYPWIPDFIDLRLKLPVRDLHKMRVLNIGVGDMTSGLARQLPHLRFKDLELIDVHKPYMTHALGLNWLAKHIGMEVKGAEKVTNFKDYDLVMIFDVLEHLEKAESIRIVKDIMSSGAKLLIFGPLELQFRKNFHGVESQDHKSLWTEQDFKDLGLKTELLKNFHQEGDNRFDAVWAWNY